MVDFCDMLRPPSLYSMRAALLAMFMRLFSVVFDKKQTIAETPLLKAVNPAQRSLSVFVATSLLAALCAISVGLIACGKTRDASSNPSQLAQSEGPRKPPAGGPAVTSPAGAWEGLLKTNLGEGRFSLKLHRDGDKWAGEMRDYSNKDRESYLPLKDLTVEGNGISFAVQPIADSPRYVGKLSDDGESISGDMISGDLRIPLNLKRKGE
jgi:hypothetical protein